MCGVCGAWSTFDVDTAMPDRASSNRVLTGDCEVDCVNGCAYPGQFSECSLGDGTTHEGWEGCCGRFHVHRTADVGQLCECGMLIHYVPVAK